METGGHEDNQLDTAPYNGCYNGTLDLREGAEPEDQILGTYCLTKLCLNQEWETAQRIDIDGFHAVYFTNYDVNGEHLHVYLPFLPYAARVESGMDLYFEFKTVCLIFMFCSTVVQKVKNGTASSVYVTTVWPY